MNTHGIIQKVTDAVTTRFQSAAERENLVLDMQHRAYNNNNEPGFWNAFRRSENSETLMSYMYESTKSLLRGVPAEEQISRLMAMVVAYQEKDRKDSATIYRQAAVIEQREVTIRDQEELIEQKMEESDVKEGQINWQQQEMARQASRIREQNRYIIRLNDTISLQAAADKNYIDLLWEYGTFFKNRHDTLKQKYKNTKAIRKKQVKRIIRLENLKKLLKNPRRSSRFLTKKHS